MALPTKAEVLTLDYTDWSLPAVWIDVTSSGGGSSDVSNNAYVNVNGSWKQSDDIYVNVSGAWKNVTNDIVYANINGSWKNLTSGGGSVDSSTLDYVDWSLPIVGRG
tara:strand:+ start:3528 stop:3848 length:321 start_codon:yes stop_codon:yes gene_type:complete